MSQQTYLKVPFVWEGSKPLIEVPSRLEFKPAKTLSHEVLVSAVAQVMESSIDASDQKQVMERGSRQVAEQFLAESKDGFSYQNEWWQIGVTSDNKAVGFVFPVIYQGCAKDGLEEATIYYIGVLPEYRGQGFATDLLLKGTRVLQDVGVWKVLCDTDVNNIPMISTFKRVGYQQYSEPWQRPL
ncbi:GNAT family N-acetyltransferase [Mastigocladopsis repens]|uniref:GNAT family N-acetyltransferase n=1 Tax=Mastigocladopsis repens TaxID=221287 RepID=UPI00030F5964|nr:GNAT family N-acetyltransferase [Mastigocladopsis repens]